MEEQPPEAESVRLVLEKYEMRLVRTTVPRLTRSDVFRDGGYRARLENGHGRWVGGVTWRILLLTRRRCRRY